jgi:hypothetical protein
MDLKTQHACITFIASRLITGKSPAFLYNLRNSGEIEIAAVLDTDFLREFNEKHRDYVPGYASDCSYHYSSGSCFSLDIFINKKTFVVHINDTDAYFIGNIWNDTIYLYDYNKSSPFRYRMATYIEDHKKEEKPKVNVMYEDDED